MAQVLRLLFQPLFKVSAQGKSLHSLSDDEIDTLKKERRGDFSETQVMYFGHGVLIKIIYNCVM